MTMDARRSNCPLEDLLLACTNITDQALSCRTLPSSQRLSTAFNDDNDKSSCIDASLHEEREISRWMNRQIIEYQTAALAHHPTTTAVFSPSAASVSTLQRQLVQASAQIQQEHALVSRIVQSQVALQTSFVTATAVDNIINPLTEATRLLRQQAVQSRNAQVAIALAQSQTLDRVRRQVQEAAEYCRRQQDTNRHAYRKDMHALEQQNASTAMDSVDPGLPAAETQRQTKENLILQRALADLLAGSRLDWYSDERLRQIMLRLDE